jgi:hypothetical protein
MDAFTVLQLKDICKQKKIKGYSKLKKAELYNLLFPEDVVDIDNKTDEIKNKDITDTSNNQLSNDIMDIKNDFNITIVSAKVKYLRTIGYDSLEDWLKNPDNLYLGRKGRVWIHSDNDKKVFYYPDSIYGNPFKLSDFKSTEECLESYKNHVINTPLLYQNLDSLKNKNIACFCDIDKPCHIKVLLFLLKNKK